jgi:hypothetical protein
MGASGTAMTINSHILMSLSRSATSRSEHEEQEMQSSQKRKLASNKVNLNFKNEQDNICNLAVNFKMMTEENYQNVISEESRTNVKSSTEQSRGTGTNLPRGNSSNRVVEQEVIKNYLTNTT